MSNGTQVRLRVAIVLALAAFGLVAAWLLRRPDEGPDPSPSEVAGRAPAAPTSLAGAGQDDEAIASDAPSGADAPADGTSPFRIVGRVFDGGYRPAPDVLVTVEDGRSAPATDRTDAEGRFDVPIPTAPAAATEYGVRARAVDGRCAATFVRGLPGRPVAEAGGLVLVVGHVLEVRAVADGRPVTNAEVHVSTVLPFAPPSFVSGSGAPFVGWSHRARTDGSGVAHLDAVPLGDVRVLVRGPGPVRGEARVQRREAAAEPVLVRCEPARDVEVIVVRAETGAPIEGAHLQPYDEDGWPPSDPGATPDTDAQGRALFRAVPFHPTFSVTVVHDGVRWPFGFSRLTAVPPLATTLRIEMPRGDTLRFPLEPGDGPLPDAGTGVRVRTIADDEWVAAGDLRRDGRVRDGAVEIVRVRGESVRAVLSLSDGRVAEARTERVSGLVTPQPVRFRSPRTLTVRLTDVDGGTAAGCDVRLFLEGGARASVSTPVDSTGRATFPGLLARAYDVRVDPCPELVEPYRRGVFRVSERVDLSEGDVTLAVVVARREEALVRVRIAGVPGLPRDVVIRAGLSSETLDPRVPEGVVVDGSAGEIRILVRPPPGLLPYLELSTRDYGSARARLARGEDGRLGGVIDLAPTGRILLRTRVPADRDAAWAEGIDPERLGDDGRYVPAGVGPLPPLDDRPDLLYLGVPPGRYRARDGRTGRVSDPVEVIAGRDPALLVLDVSRSQVVEGTIELPEGLGPEKARVLVLGEGIDPEGAHPPITVLAPDRFRVTIPGDRPVRLVPAAEGCVPDPALPEVVLESAAPGIRLRLVRAPPR